MNEAYDGILIINKEKGYTSNDVVAVLRGILHMKKIGHTGTLDPDAEGVLPVCLGKGTKLVSLLTDKVKDYTAVARLGIETDTEDMSGTVLRENDVAVDDRPDADKVRAALSSFIGGYDQIPPMYSAKKVNGKKLYELAREGLMIERKPCHVEIHDIRLISYNYPLLEFSVSCGKGTYIRSLIRDLGQSLGTGAAMESLIRTRVSSFHLVDALRLGEVEELSRNRGIESRIFCIESVFSELPLLNLPMGADKSVKNGNPFRVPAGHRDGDYRVHLPDGSFAAVYSVSKGQAKVKRMFL